MKAHRNHTCRIAVLAFLVCLVPAWMMAAEPAPVVLRTSIAPDTGIWVGQRVLYQIDVLGKDGWARIQRLPDIQVSGAVAIPFESQGVRLNETIGGDTYTGQRYTLSLFPQRSGTISVPPVTVDVEIVQWGDKAGNRVLPQKTPSVRFEAAVPPGGEAVKGLISTTRLTAEQQWEPDTATVAVGDAIKRRIDLKAEDVSAMALTPIVFSGSASVDVYRQDPVVEDRYDRGTLTGRRTETATYVFKNSGRIELPAVTVTWWDLENNRLRETVLPSRSIEISPSSAVSGGRAAETSAFGNRAWIAIAAVVILAIALTVLFEKRVRRHWHAWRQRRSRTEKAFFKRFVRAARSGQPANALNALMRWLDRIDTRGRAARLDRFLENYSDAAGVQAAGRLWWAVGPDSNASWQGRGLIEAMTLARRRWLAEQRQSMTRHRRLPRLNPKHL
jgi:hypothetical protein